MDLKCGQKDRCMRSFSDLTPAEQNQYRMHQRRLENGLSTAEEKKESRQILDFLLSKGPMQPYFDKVHEHESKIESMHEELIRQRQAIEDLIADAIEEAKTVIYAEAAAAAKEQVELLLQDRPEPGLTQSTSFEITDGPEPE